mmetsp:Transcript_8050/g.25088  ORF Transcript_8050/g.25088 Transcript_8050/m.25088 type:complete len:247 (+) Transcript_8050:1864-2604(+)
MRADSKPLAHVSTLPSSTSKTRYVHGRPRQRAASEQPRGRGSTPKRRCARCYSRLPLGPAGRGQPRCTSLQPAARAPRRHQRRGTQRATRTPAWATGGRPRCSNSARPRKRAEAPSATWKRCSESAGPQAGHSRRTSSERTKASAASLARQGPPRWRRCLVGSSRQGHYSAGGASIVILTACLPTLTGVHAICWVVVTLPQYETPNFGRPSTPTRSFSSSSIGPRAAGTCGPSSPTRIQAYTSSAC